VVLSHHVVDHVVLNRTMRDSLAHQVRWMKSTRFSRPRGHIGAGLTFAVPFGIIAALASAALGMPGIGVLLLAYALFNRMAEALIAGWGVVRDPLTLRYFWLYPVRDVLGFALWSGSFRGTSIRWRGEIYNLQTGGTMVRAGASVCADAATAITEPAGVSEL
jgi:ceramide glucosyltransferase